MKRFLIVAAVLAIVAIPFYAVAIAALDDIRLRFDGAGWIGEFVSNTLTSVTNSDGSVSAEVFSMGYCEFTPGGVANVTVNLQSSRGGTAWANAFTSDLTVINSNDNTKLQFFENAGGKYWRLHVVSGADAFGNSIQANCDLWRE